MKFKRKPTEGCIYSDMTVGRMDGFTACLDGIYTTFLNYYF